MNKKLEKACAKAHKNDRKKKPSLFPCRVAHLEFGLGYAIVEKKKGIRVQFLSGKRLTIQSKYLRKITLGQL